MNYINKWTRYFAWYQYSRSTGWLLSNVDKYGKVYWLPKQGHYSKSVSDFFVNGRVANGFEPRVTLSKHTQITMTCWANVCAYVGPILGANVRPTWFCSSAYVGATLAPNIGWQHQPNVGTGTLVLLQNTTSNQLSLKCVLLCLFVLSVCSGLLPPFLSPAYLIKSEASCLNSDSVVWLENRFLWTAPKKVIKKMSISKELHFIIIIINNLTFVFSYFVKTPCVPQS